MLSDVMEAQINLSPGGRMGRDDKSSMDAHGKAGNMGGSMGKKKEPEKNKRMSANAKDPLKKQQEMNRAVRKGVDRLGTAIKSVQDKPEKKTDDDAAAKRRAKLKSKFGKSINTGMREEVSTLRQGWGDAYSSIYEKKLDPVGQEDGDIDNDGDKDSSDKYLAKRRKAISKAMGGKKEKVEELYKGKHGQSEKDYQDSRSDAGKMVSGDSKGSGANYSYRAKNTGSNPAGGSEKPQGQGRMTSGARTDLQFRKAALKNKMAQEGLDPKGAARMDAAKGKKKETQDQINKRLMLGKYAPGAKKESVEFSQEELDRIEQIVNSWED